MVRTGFINLVLNFSAAILFAGDTAPTTQAVPFAVDSPLGVIASLKNAAQFSDAARGVALAPVYKWYGQPHLMNATTPGGVLVPDVAINEARTDVYLSQWLTSWRKDMDRDAVSTQGARELLGQILQKTKLSSFALIDIGRAVDFMSADEELEVEFYAAAAYRAANELSQIKDDPIRRCDLLLALNSCRPRMWDVIDDGHHEWVPALQLLCQSVASWDFTGNRLLDKDQPWAEVDEIECFYLSNQTKQGLALAAKLDQQDLPRDVRFGSDFAYALILMQANMYRDAISHLDNVSNSPTPKYYQQGLMYLAISYAALKDATSANDAFKEWIRKSHPSVEETASLLRRIKQLLGRDLPS